MARSLCRRGQQIPSIFGNISEFSRPLSHHQSRLNVSKGTAPIAEFTPEELKEEITGAVPSPTEREELEQALQVMPSPSMILCASQSPSRMQGIPRDLAMGQEVTALKLHPGGSC